MAHSNDPTINSFWQQYSDQNTRNLKNEFNLWDVPEIKPGNEQLHFVVGQQVTTTSKSAFKPGLTLVIEDCQITNGFARYLAGGVWHKQEDLV